MAFMTFAENLTKSLEPMLASYSATLLEKISEDYGLSYDELSEKYLSGAIPVPLPKVKGQSHSTGTKKKSAKVELPQCSGVTAKGGQCNHKAFDESGLCRIHQKKAAEPKAKEPKEPKEKKKAKKVKKGPPPEHTHEPTVSDPLCGLCESHGNPINPELPSTDFESDGLADRLKALIMSEVEPANESEVEPANESEVEPANESEVEPANESEVEPDELSDRLKALIMSEGEPEIESAIEPEDESDVESDYEDEGDALTAALRNMMMNEE